MRISREKAEDLLEELKNIVGVMDCMHATDHRGIDKEAEGYYDDVEISVSSYTGEGVFTLKIGSGELIGLYEILSGIELSLRSKLDRDLEIEIH